LDTADTGTVDGGDLDVTLVTPGSTPGVSDNIVVLSTLSSISNGGDGVVEGGSAGGGVKDTTVVHLEDRFVGLNGDGYDLLIEGSLELRYAVGWNLVVSSNSDLTKLGLSNITGASLSMSRGIWVVGLKSVWVLLEVLESLVLPSTLASVALGIAGDELLLRE